MTTINVNTKIASLLKQHSGALDAIVSISPKFNKLRNPLLRKLMASRTSIGMASKIGGCSANDFFDKLQPLGFCIDRSIKEENNTEEIIPAFMKNADLEKTLVLDVRPTFDSGKDPLQLILKSINQLEAGQILKLINSFEPIPLIQLLSKQGFESYVESTDENLVQTYFHKKEGAKVRNTHKTTSDKNWEEVLESYKDKMKTIDVRGLEMPLPMLTILDALDKLPKEQALFVYHKRIPVFLLPELEERKFSFRTRELGNSEVHLIIFKN